MLAISNSGRLGRIAKKLAGSALGRFHAARFRLHLAVLAGLLFFPGLLSLASPEQSPAKTPSAPVDFAARARISFQTAQVRYLSETNHPESAWHYARACFDLGEFATNHSERAEVANRGISVARELVSRHPELAEAHYYLAMNLGQLARTKSLGALRLVAEMEVEFLAARRLDEHFDFAGPDRNLGLLYWQAPSFGSIGSRSKARFHLRRSVELLPGYPDNRLNLIEAYLKWGERKAAAAELKVLEDLWPQARKSYSGENWALSWTDWNQRLRSCQEKLAGEAAPVTSPKQKVKAG